MGERPLRHWSQSDWTIFFGSQGPTIREIVECLGLLHINDRGDPKFSERELRRLSIEVQRLSQALPTDPEALLRSAVDPKALDEELNALLSSHGAAIWGEAADRRRLLIAAGTSKTSPLKELFFEIPADRAIGLKTHLHRWIYKKAHTSVQSRKPTRQSAARNVTISSGDDATQSAESRPAPPSAGLLHDEALTISSVTPPAHALNQRDPFTKRKADLENSVPNDFNAIKRVRQSAARSVEQSSQEPVSERLGDASSLDDIYPSPPAVHSVAATSMRPSTLSGMSSSLPSRHVQNAILSSNSPLTSTFAAVNRVPTDNPITTDFYCLTGTHTAPTLPGASLLSVASSMPSNGGQMRASPSLNSQCQGRHGTSKSVQTPHTPMPPVSQVTLHRPRSLFQDKAARILPSPPADVSESHHITGHKTDQRQSLNRSQTPAPREPTFKECDLLWLLLRYLFPRVDEKIEVSILLRSLEQVWASHEEDFRLAMDQQFECHRNVLFIWIRERQKATQLRLMIDCQPSAQTPEMVDRVLVMNDLRILRLKWKALEVHGDTQNSNPEDLLCSTFTIMTRTQGTEALFKEGLDRLKEASPEVGRPENSVISIYT